MCSCYILITRDVCRQCASQNETTLLKGGFFRENPQRAVNISKQCRTHSLLILPRGKQYENKLKDYPRCPTCRERRARPLHRPGPEPVPKEPARYSRGMSRLDADPRGEQYGPQRPGPEIVSKESARHSSGMSRSDGNPRAEPGVQQRSRAELVPKGSARYASGMSRSQSDPNAQQNGQQRPGPLTSKPRPVERHNQPRPRPLTSKPPAVKHYTRLLDGSPPTNTSQRHDGAVRPCNVERAPQSLRRISYTKSSD